MLVVTTNELERHSVKSYYGLVTGESISGVNLFRDFFASVRDIFGGRVRSYEKELLAAQETALNEMIERETLAPMRSSASILITSTLAEDNRCFWCRYTARPPKSSQHEKKTTNHVKPK